MTTYNTGNPIGSTDARDLYDNAQILDKAVNGTGTYADRFGVARRSLAKMDSDFSAQLADAESDLNVYRADAAVSASQALGYLNTIRTTSYGAYASDPDTDPLGNPPTIGDEYFNTTGNLLKRFNGATWQASDINTANLAAPTGASLVGYTPAGTGAVATTVQSKLRETVSVTDFYANGVSGAKVDPTGVIDSTLGIQAAINTGKHVVFPAGSYKANNLTQSTGFQRFYAHGHVNIIKNANGPLLTASGSYVEFDGLQFIGTGFAGDNVVATGNHPRFINCASYGAAGRALKATGGHVQIIGTCGIYATTDTSATGYDIEIGVSGTATLYHELWGVYTSQATGGILLVDTGTHHIVGGQFGKLTIKYGTSPAGVNGGMTIGARILGDVLVEQSNAVFSGNQFSTVTITFAAGTGQHTLDTSNNLVNSTIVNNGNGNSPIVKSIGSGNPTGIRLQYGQDNYGNPVIRYVSGDIYFENSHLNMANGKALKFADSAGTVRNGISLSSGDDWSIGGFDAGAASGNFMNIIAGSGGMYLVVDGASRVQVTDSYFRPIADGSYNLGSAANRFNTIYATNATISTSDEREKQDIASLDDAEKRVAVTLKGMVKKFRFRDAVKEKGDGARLHVGVIAQEVVAAFQSEGLDAMRYGIICYDEWEAEGAVNHADSGEIVSPAREAGNRYGIRYEELLAFVISAL